MPDHDRRVPQPTGTEVNELIRHLHRIAIQLDEAVHDVALETGLTERAEITADYDARQRVVRAMVRLTHELNSLLPDRLGDRVPDDAQPTEYGPPWSDG
jgi:hypothetical protein